MKTNLLIFLTSGIMSKYIVISKMLKQVSGLQAILFSILYSIRFVVIFATFPTTSHLTLEIHA